MSKLCEILTGLSKEYVKSIDKIEIIVTENREAIIWPISKKVDDLFGKLHKLGRKPVSIEAIDDAISNRMKDKFK